LADSQPTVLPPDLFHLFYQVEIRSPAPRKGERRGCAGTLQEAAPRRCFCCYLQRKCSKRGMPISGRFGSP